MMMKWLETAMLHEANADGPGDGGGSGDSVSTGVDGGAGDPAPISETHDTSESSAPAATPAAPATPSTSTPIAFPNALANIFAPRPAAPSQGPPSNAPAQGPSPPTAPAPAAGPLKPNRSLAVTDPEAYAEQLEAYYDSRLDAVQKGSLSPVEQLRSELQREREQQWSHAFENAKRVAKDALPRHWDNILAKDSDFNTNPQLQGAVQDIIGYFVDKKIQEGDIDGLHLAADPKFIRRSLLIAKDELGIGRAPSYRPGGGPSLVGPQGHAAPGVSLVDDETRAAIAEADRDGYRYSEEQIAKALKRRNT